TPLQQPPVGLLPSGTPAGSGLDCSASEDQRVITNQMVEALDAEIGRLLVETGLAILRDDGSLDYRPEQTNTVVVIVGDNSTYGPRVKAPFNPTRAKGFPDQTGVWVPLIVAGPMVAEPGRSLPHMVNSTDLFSLFAELAEIDLNQAVPETRQIDAQPLLAYLTDPGHASIRSTNYTEMGNNIQPAGGEQPAPCALPTYNICVQ